MTVEQLQAEPAGLICFRQTFATYNWFWNLCSWHWWAKHNSVWNPNLVNVLRQLPLQIVPLQLHLCDVRLVVVHHLNVHKMIENTWALKIAWTCSWNWCAASIFFACFDILALVSFTFIIELRDKEAETRGLPPTLSGVGGTQCQLWPHPECHWEKKYSTNIPTENHPRAHSCQHQLFLLVGRCQVHPRDLQGQMLRKSISMSVCTLAGSWRPETLKSVWR